MLEQQEINRTRKNASQKSKLKQQSDRVSGHCGKLGFRRILHQLSQKTLRNERDLKTIKVLLAHYSRGSPSAVRAA